MERQFSCQQVREQLLSLAHHTGELPTSAGEHLREARAIGRKLAVSRRDVLVQPGEVGSGLRRCSFKSLKPRGGFNELLLKGQLLGGERLVGVNVETDAIAAQRIGEQQLRVQTRVLRPLPPQPLPCPLQERAHRPRLSHAVVPRRRAARLPCPGARADHAGRRR